MEVEYSKIAIDNLLEFNQVDRKLIVKKIEYLVDNFEILKKSKKIRELKGEYKSKYRFLVARKIRVIFQVKDTQCIVLILRIGKRKEIY